MVEPLYVLCGSTPYQWWAGGEKVVSPLKADNIFRALDGYNVAIRNFLVGVVEYRYSVVSPSVAINILPYEVDNYHSVELARP